MEFKVENKTKRLTLALMIVGGLFTLIGIIMNYDADHFITRFLGNTLVNSFFFFCIGLGALFFLALQYATETGWYATVKRVIEALTGFLPIGIALLLVSLLIRQLPHYHTIHIFS